MQYQNPILNRLVTALFCQALVDGVGDPFEFMRKKQFTPNDILHYAKNSPKIEYTDDTQMTLFGLEAEYRHLKYGTNFSDEIKTGYLNWYRTQTGVHTRTEAPLYELLSVRSLYNRIPQPQYKLISAPSLHKQKAPGMTCLSALESLSAGRVVKNDSMGCGSVMRLLPHLIHYKDRDTCISHGIESAFVTHHGHQNIGAVTRLLTYAHDLLIDADPMPLFKGIEVDALGEGWIAPECVDMAICAYENSSTFDELMVKSIHHSGDSDSVGAVAGMLWGLSGKPIDYSMFNRFRSDYALELGTYFICESLSLQNL